MHKIAISADIKEMFHQVRIRKEDQNFQRFLWRNSDLTRDPDTYVMEVMTFGAACSPCSAQFVKNKNALESENQYPRAVKSIRTITMSMIFYILLTALKMQSDWPKT